MRLAPYIIGPVTARNDGTRETIAFFGYTATRIIVPGGRDLYYRAPEDEDIKLSDNAFGD